MMARRWPAGATSASELEYFEAGLVGELLTLLLSGLPTNVENFVTVLIPAASATWLAEAPKIAGEKQRPSRPASVHAQPPRSLPHVRDQGDLHRVGGEHHATVVQSLE
jgi:hypothetical protein